MVHILSSGEHGILRRLQAILARRRMTELPAEVRAELQEILREQRSLRGKMEEVLHKLDRLAVTAHAEAALVPLDYPARYRQRYPHGTRPIDKQIVSLGGLCEMPESSIPAALEYAQWRSRRPLPEGAEGLFAAVWPEYLAPSYWEAVGKILCQMEDTFYGPRYHFERTFFSDKENKQWLQEEEQSRYLFKQVIQDQESPIVVFPGQFGKLYAAASALDVRGLLAQEGNDVFGLGLFAICCMALTHPERFAFGALGVGCPGDICKYKNDESEDLNHVPGINFDVWVGRLLQLRCDRHIMRYRNMGMATGFLFTK